MTTPSEFKAWFEGFALSIAEAPTPEQWLRIKAKVEEMAVVGHRRVTADDSFRNFSPIFARPR